MEYRLTICDMQIDDTPLFRKIIIPWYDSEALCLLTIVLMDVVFLFGVAGVSVALSHPAFHGYIWVPIMIMVLSGAVIVSVTIRLIRRYADWLRRRND